MAQAPTYRGRWWPWTDPTLAFGGSLSHAGRYGYELELTGTPDEIAQLGAATIDGTPIYGHTNDGSDITVRYLPLSAMPGASSTTLPVERAMVGIHDHDPRFESASFGFRNLAAWSGRKGALRPEIETPGVITGVTYERLTNLTAIVGDATLTIGDAFNATSSLEGDTLARTVGFSLKMNTPVSFGELLGKYLRPIQHLMTFANDKGLAINDLLLTPADDCRRSVTPIYDPIFDPVETDGDNWRPLFTLEQATGGFSELVSRWFDFYARAMPLLDLLFLPRYIERIPFTEQSLLIYAQAAEGLHQRLFDRFDQTSLSRDDHSELMAQVAKGISDPELLRWARDRLERNDRSFKQRIMDLIEYAGPALDEILKPTPSKWANQLRTARNHWTHWSPKVSHQLDGAEAWRLSAALAAVLECCILAELGFDEDLRSKIIRQSDNYRWAAVSSIGS